MWDASLELVTSVRAAHGGGKVYALAVGPDGLIYTGGDDKVCTQLLRVVCRFAFVVAPFACHLPHHQWMHSCATRKWSCMAAGHSYVQHCSSVALCHLISHHAIKPTNSSHS